MVRLDVERLARVSSTLLSASTPRAVIETVTQDGIFHLGGDAGLVCLVDSEDRLLRPVSFSGFQPSAVAAFYPMSLEAGLPLSLAAREVRNVWVEDPGQRERDFPELARRLPPVVTASMPVRLPDGRLLVFGLRFGAGHRFSEEERSYLVALVNQAALALNGLLDAQPDTRTDEERWVAEAEEELRRRLLDELQQAQKLVKVGTWQWNAATDTMTWSPEMYAISGIDQGTAPLSVERAAQALHPDDAVATLAARDQALRDGKPFSVTQRVRRPDGSYRHAVTRGEVLLDRNGRVIGMRGTSQDVTEEMETSRRLAQAHEALLRRTYELEREQRIREALQSVLLPASLPEREHTRLGARYVSAEAPAAVGGDWYDAFWVTPDELVIVVGDVSGHDMEAAAMMGQVRSSLRAYALEGHKSPGILQLLNALIIAWGADHLATVICGSLDVATGMFAWVSAGHVPPVLVHDGGARLLSNPPGVMLGVVDQPRFGTGRCRLEPHDVLVLYTDGLVERRGESITDGLERFRALVAQTARDDLDAFCETVTGSQLGGRSLEDDGCVLAVHLVRRA